MSRTNPRESQGIEALPRLSQRETVRDIPLPMYARSGGRVNAPRRRRYTISIYNVMTQNGHYFGCKIGGCRNATATATLVRGNRQRHLSRGDDGEALRSMLATLHEAWRRQYIASLNNGGDILYQVYYCSTTMNSVQKGAPTATVTPRLL